MVLMWFSLSVARMMPPYATRPPTVPVPAPDTVTGIRSRLARASVSETSSMLSGITTRSAWPSRMKLASVRNDSISSGFDFVCITRFTGCSRIHMIILNNLVSPVSHDLELALAQYLDAIAQLRRPLKLKPLCRRAHLDLQPRDRRFEIRRRVVLNLFDFRRHLEVIRFRRRNQRRFDRFHNRPRRDPILTIEHFLYRSSSLRLFNRPLHRRSHTIGIQDRLAACVARRAPNRLYQRLLRPQKTFLVRIEN